LNEFLWRHHAFEIMFRPNFSHDFSKFLNDGAVGSCVTDGIQKEFTDRFHVREGMQSDVDVVSVGKVIETNEAREIGDAMDITGKGRALSFGGEGGREERRARESGRTFFRARISSLEKVGLRHLLTSSREDSII
jgi:hypothetical protein